MKILVLFHFPVIYPEFMTNYYLSMLTTYHQPPPNPDHMIGIHTLANARRAGKLLVMFTIEHTFDCSVITLVDEGQVPLNEDIIINTFEDCVTITQFDPRTEQAVKIMMSLEQVRDLGAALDLPEGVYRLRPPEA
jgi:hypothetical protein